MSLIKKVFTSEIKSIDEKEMTLTASISTNAVDRMREVLDPKGADLSNFKKNPVVLWAHDYSLPPIGRALWVKKEGDGIISKVQFAKTDFAQEIFQLYKDGFMKAFSVGFIPKETEEASAKDCDNPKKPRRTFKTWELLEYSAVPVPANPEALSLAMQKGILKQETKELLEKEFNNEDEWTEEDEKQYEEEVTKTEIINTDANPVTFGSGKTIEIKIDNKPLIKETSFEEFQSELKEQTNKIELLEKENAELRFKLYELLNKKTQTKNPEITVDNLAEKIVEVCNGVIRKAQGKIN